ncbi:SGNH/GDSL hydrolase family protein [Kribbella sp. NPDC026611]|uniref:SGNH/GDSL hydrolase family protein n=1 Tax=Kribbella sp. NPDC026611 TaxID=3154911 RepID=UPI0033CA9924
MARSRWVEASVAVLAAVLAGVLATVTAVPASAAPALRYHLALGDSLAYGFQRVKVGQPPSAFRTGYADLLAARLRHAGRLPELVNYGCPGETTASFASGSCPWSAAGFPLHDTFSAPQLDAATEFLRAHRGRVDLVTVSLWGNDANDFVASCNGNVQCIVDGAPAAIARLAAARAQFVDPMPVFDAGGGTALCTYTLLCRDGDAHPSDTGYAALADLAEAKLN